MSSSPCLSEDLPGPRNNSLKGIFRVTALRLRAHVSARPSAPLSEAISTSSIQGEQSNRPIGGGEGMGDVASQSGHVADLRSGDQVTGFGQSLGVRASQRVMHDAVDRDGGTNEEFLSTLTRGESALQWNSHRSKFERVDGDLVPGQAADRFPLRLASADAARVRMRP